MVENISSKVKLLPRKLPDNNPVLIKDKDKETEDKITVASKFRNDSSLTEVTKKYEKVLINSTKSFIDKKSSDLCQKTGPSIKNRLVNNRQFSLNSKVTKSSPCHQRNCRTYPMIINKEELLINGKKVKSTPGTCHSYNVTYGIICNLCNKYYVGRTTRPLHERITEHRIKFYELPFDSQMNFMIRISITWDHT